MTDDATRADRTAGRRDENAPGDLILVRDYVVESEIGAFRSERGRTQRLRFNVDVEVAARGAGEVDDVDRILSYDTITDAIAAALAADRLNLLETLAERIAGRILSDPLAVRCRLRIEKLDRGPGALGVEITRSAGRHRSDTAPAPTPRIVHLSNAAIASDRLGAWLAQIAKEGPAILCVGAPEVRPPAATDRAAARQIALLAVEQNAWVLAARDARLSVAGSWTELDWALRHGRLTVWAPAKLVLDAAAPPDFPPERDADPAAWLAARMRANALLVIGAEAPDCDIPTATAELSADRLP